METKTVLQKCNMSNTDVKNDSNIDFSFEV